ncbi:MAG: sigma-70 family RNA polymerase sigma factor [Nitrospinae bacterium]|nr:sigma-70 family RNA polymerase sigma factor [Nitrospinota bacterium]
MITSNATLSVAPECWKGVSFPEMEGNGTALPDERMVALALGGDGKAYAELVRRYKKAVLQMAGRVARDELEVDEIAQDVFVKVHANLKHYRGDAPVEHWIMRIASNTCRDVLRKRKNTPLAVAFEKVEGALQNAPAPEEDKEVETLRRAMEKLGADDRMLLTLLELEDKKVKEVASILGISEGNVKVRAHRARKVLKELFGKETENHG